MQSWITFPESIQAFRFPCVASPLAAWLGRRGPRVVSDAPEAVGRARGGSGREGGGRPRRGSTHVPSSLSLFPSCLSFLILFLSPLLPPYPSSPSFSFLHPCPPLLLSLLLPSPLLPGRSPRKREGPERDRQTETSRQKQTEREEMQR